MLFLGLSGCDATRLYHVDGWYEKEVNTACGQVSFHVQRGLGPQSSVGMFLFPTDSIDIQLDKIRLLYKGKALTYKTQFHNIGITSGEVHETRFKFGEQAILHIFFNAKNLSTDSLVLDFRNAFSCNAQPLFDSLVVVKGPYLTQKQFEMRGRN